MMVITTIRMTEELRDILFEAAAVCRMTYSEVLRAVACGMRNERPAPNIVVDSEKMKVTTDSGPVVIRVDGGVLLPDRATAKVFRRQIFLRCRHEIDRARSESAKRPAVPQSVEGVDYNVPDAVAAVKLGIV